MSASGQAEKSGRATGKSALPSTADFVSGQRHVSKVQMAEEPLKSLKLYQFLQIVFYAVGSR
jgi:hypothetical protein